MDQISAAVRSEYEGGAEYLVTDYVSRCGCQWSVDHRGNVRQVYVCRDCMKVAVVRHHDQMDMF